MHSSTPRRILTGSIASLVAIFASIPSTAKADATWVGATSADWNNAANWDSSPSDPTGSFIINGAGITPVLSATSAFSPGDIKIGSFATGRLDQTAGTLSAGSGNWTFIGQNSGGNGTYNLADTTSSGGTLTGFGTGSGSFNTTRLYVGLDGGGAVGAMNINTTGTVTVSNDIYIGNNGTGVVQMDAGTLNQTGGWIAIGSATGNGALNMSGGLVTGAGDTVVGLDSGSIGALNMTGGTYTTGGQLQIGRNGGSGTVTVNGPSAILNVGNELHIGEDGSGASSMTVSAGTVNVNSWLTASRGTTQGTLTITGTGVLNQGLTDAGSRLEITNPGGTGTGTVNLDGGTLSTNGIVVSGDAAGTSIFNFNGGTLKPRADNGGFMGGLDRANVRNGGANIDTNGFNITIGQALVHSDIFGDAAVDGGLTKSGAGTLTLTAQNTFNGGVTINQGTVATLGGGQTGRLGQGPVTVNAGAFLQSNSGDSFGFFAGGPSVINVVGGTITSTSGAFRTTLPNLNMTGGTLTSAGNTGDASGVFSFNAGTTVTTNAAATSALFDAAQVGMQDVVTYAVAKGGASTDLQVSSALSDVTYGGNAGGINKTGAGTMTLTSHNTYTGPTTINAGTLEVQNDGTIISGKISGSIAPDSVMVNGGGTLLLSGSGNWDRIADTTGITLHGGTLFKGSASSEGTGASLSGGTPSGTSAVGLGALTLSANSTIDFGTGGVGTLTFDNFDASTFTLNILNWSGTASGNDLTTSGVDGRDDRLIFRADLNFAGFLDQISFNGVGAAQINLGGSYYEIVPIPEPSSTALLGAVGLLGLVGYRRRRLSTVWDQQKES